MNLILIESVELETGDTVHLVDRRAEHIRRVLRASQGDLLRVGLVDGPLGTGEVISVEESGVRLRCHLEPQGPPRPRDLLLLAVPRPKVLLRIYEHATALGFGEIFLFRSWRVDRSHLGSRALSPELRERHLRRGLEQARRTHVPRVRLFELFRPFVEDELEGLARDHQRFLAHPGAAPGDAPPVLDARPFAVAIGPEGGFIPYEIEQLEARGFQPLSLGPHPLRVETAVAVAHARLGLLREQGGSP